METIYELKEKLRKAEEAEREKRRQEAMKREKEWRENNIIDVGWSDDYYSLDVGDMSFYYGYEETMCPEWCKCSIDDDDCDKKERCFVARRWKEELMRIPTSKLTYKHRNIEDMVLLWVWMYIASLSTS